METPKELPENLIKSNPPSSSIGDQVKSRFELFLSSKKNEIHLKSNSRL